MTDRKARPSFRRSQGYSLVEIGIVLVVMLMIASTAAWNFSDRFRTDQNDGVNDYMKATHEAVITYSTENRTRGTFVIYDAGVSTVTVHVPSGRPTLPCPDLDGDGYEDRHDTISITPTVTVSIAVISRVTTAVLDDVPLRCVDDKGLLPWRTLKTNPADYWGQHFTYWVDNNFSNGVFGFDQTTRGSNIFKHAVIRDDTRENTYHYLTQSNVFTEGRSARFSSGVVLQFQPTSNNYVVHAGDVFEGTSTPEMSLTEQRRLDTADGTLGNVLEYGNINPFNFPPLTVTVSPTNAKVPFVSNGLAFAIVSHGLNGYGGRVSEHGRATATDFTCKVFADYTNNALLEEKLNARHNFPCNAADLAPSGCATGLAAACQTAARPTGFFFVSQRTPLASGGETFDDVVTWMLPGTLVNRLTRDGTLPLPLPPVAYIR